MEIKDKLAEAIAAAATSAIESGALPEAALPKVELSVPPKKEMGDFATNFAMQGARAFHKNPRQIANEIVSRIELAELDHADIAGPGFINFYLKGDVLYDALAAAMAAGDEYGNLPKKDVPPIMVEYVSANPTGLLHVGHGRGAAMGSALVNLLRVAGYPVTSEYYINDAGNQIDHLAESVNARYLELLGKPCDFPEDGYKGADIIETARHIIDRDGDKYLAMDEKERVKIFKEIALKEKLQNLKDDLAAFHVTFDNWFSERTLHQGKVKEAVEELRKNGVIYEKDGAPLQLNICYYAARALDSIALLMQEQLGNIGIDAALTVQEDPDATYVATGDYDIALYCMIADKAGDPYYCVDALYRKNSKWALGGFPTDDSEALIDALQYETDVDQRAALANAVVQMTIDDNAFGYVGLFNKTTVTRKGVSGVSENCPFDFYSLSAETEME